MSNNILTQHLKDVADAIRRKKGTTDLINPQDFATEIEGISGSGGGESSWRYFDLTSVPNDTKAGLAELHPFLAKSTFGITSFALPLALGVADMITAMGVDGEARIILGDFDDKLSNLLEGDSGKQLFEDLGITEITKEQFYDLNA